MRARAGLSPVGSVKKAYIQRGMEGKLCGHRIGGTTILFLRDKPPSVQGMLDSIRVINDLIVETSEAQGQEM